VIPQAVVISTDDVNQSNSFKLGYSHGYKDGRGKKANGTSLDYTAVDELTSTEGDGDEYNEYDNGYEAGRKDGRSKKPNLFGTGVVSPEKPVEAFDPLRDRVLKVISDQLGMPLEDITLNQTHEDLGADSMDDVELVMGLEDEFEIELNDDEVERCINVADLVNLVRAKVNA
jgi:acyl carrier protein